MCKLEGINKPGYNGDGLRLRCWHLCHRQCAAATRASFPESQNSQLIRAHRSSPGHFSPVSEDSFFAAWGNVPRLYNSLMNSPRDDQVLKGAIQEAASKVSPPFSHLKKLELSLRMWSRLHSLEAWEVDHVERSAIIGVFVHS